MHLLTARDFRTALACFATIFGLLIACIFMVTKDVAALTAVSTIAIIAIISAAAAIADLVIKQKRREKGITDKMLLQNVQVGAAAGRSPFQQLRNPWINIAIAIIVSLIVVFAQFYFSA